MTDSTRYTGDGTEAIMRTGTSTTDHAIRQDRTVRAHHPYRAVLPFRGTGRHRRYRETLFQACREAGLQGQCPERQAQPRGPRARYPAQEIRHHLYATPAQAPVHPRTRLPSATTEDLYPLLRDTADLPDRSTTIQALQDRTTAAVHTTGAGTAPTTGRRHKTGHHRTTAAGVRATTGARRLPATTGLHPVIPADPAAAVRQAPSPGEDKTDRTE